MVQKQAPDKKDGTTVRLRDIEFGNVFCAPGARGFFGEGYRFHPVAKRLGMTWEGTGFVAKTTTLHPRAGNMPLIDDGITPKEAKPKCIVVRPLSGHVLNAVGLSGPGGPFLLQDGRWQKRTEPFMISFMSVAATKAERLTELRQFVRLLGICLPDFRAPVALQLNFACPNTGHVPDELYEEIGEAFDIVAGLDIPVMANFNPTVPTNVMVQTAAHPACDGLWIANTIPWGTAGIDWTGLFGSHQSPLAKYGFGNGGLSGPACLAFTINRVVSARDAGIAKPIVAGNGIQSADDVRRVRQAGADAVALGVIGIVRPWRMRSTIQAGNQYQVAA